VIARARAAFGVELPLRTLFEHPTVRELAKALERARHQVLPPITVASRDGLLPLSFAQQRLWFLAQLTPESSGYHIPIALRLTGELDRAALQASLDALIERHESLRTRFVLVQDQPAQVIVAAQPIGLEQLDLRALPAAERQRQAWKLLHASAHQPFDLERGPLLRLALLRVAADEHVLAVVMHHIVSDGASLQVIVDEFVAQYRIDDCRSD